MPPWKIAVMVVLFVIVDLVIIGAILHLAGATLRDLAKRHPRVEPLPGSVRKEFQSFRFNLVNLGGCVHVTVDERHMHLEPAWLVRVLMRMRPISIPWEAIRLEPESGRTRRFTRKYRSKYAAFKIGSVDAIGPAWALEVLRGSADAGPQSAAS